MAPYTDQDRENAQQTLLDRRGRLTRHIFAGCKLEFTNSSIADYLFWSGKNAYTVESGVQAVRTAAQTATPEASSATRHLINEVFDVKDLKSLLAASPVPHGISQSIEHFVGVLPGVACVQSGITALWHLGKAASHAWAKYKVESREGSFRCGDPRAALAAVAEVISRQQRLSASKAAINATHAAASAGGFFIDGGLFTGPASGALKALASLTYRMFLLARDIKEKYKTNKLLADPFRIDANVFGSAPILGCYLITEASAFDILNFLVAEMGQAGWMDKVDRLIPDMVVVQDQAAQYARDATLQISGLKTDMWYYRGVTRGERMSRWVKGKLGMGKKK